MSKKINIVDLTQELDNNIDSTKWMLNQLDVYDSINKNLEYYKVNNQYLIDVTSSGVGFAYLDPSIGWVPSYDAVWLSDNIFICDKKITLAQKFRKEQELLQSLLTKYQETQEIKYYFLAKKILDKRKQDLLDSIYRNKKRRKYIHRKLEYIHSSFRLRYIRNIIRNHVKITDRSSDEDEINNSIVKTVRLQFILNSKYHVTKGKSNFNRKNK